MILKKKKERKVEELKLKIPGTSGKEFWLKLDEWERETKFMKERMEQFRGYKIGVDKYKITARDEQSRGDCEWIQEPS